MEDNKDFEKGQNTEQGTRSLDDIMGQPVDEGGNGKKKPTVTLFGRTFAKKKAIMAGLGGLLVLALVGGGIAWTVSSQSKNAEPTPKAAVQEEQESYAINVGVKADGWDAETSTPVIVHVVNETEGIDFYHAYDANEPEFLNVAVEDGYEASFISPVNVDGSIYKVPDASKVDASEVDSADELPFTFERIAAEEVTTEELNELAASVTAAVKAGDETLTGENGVKVAELVAENIKANANADKETVEEESQAAETSASSSKSAAKTEGKTQPQTSNSNSGNKGGSTSSSNNSGSSSKPSGGNSGSGSSSQTHTHNWVAQTKTVHHDAVYKTVHHNTEYKTVHHDAVTAYRSICNGCGADITGNVDAHMENALLNGNTACGAYHTENVVIQQAYDEQVLIKDAWDEQVLVSAAYDETVTTGYKCSGCGATK